MAVIYALVDKRFAGELHTEGVRYVGYTTCLGNRTAAYTPRTAHSAKLRAWLRDLAAAGLKPEVRVLERVEKHDPQHRERHWLHHYQDAARASGVALLNGITWPTAPGPGWRESIEWRRRFRKAAPAPAHTAAPTPAPRLLPLPARQVLREVAKRVAVLPRSEAEPMPQAAQHAAARRKRTADTHHAIVACAVGRAIAEARAAAGLSQSALARKAGDGIRPEHVSRWERGAMLASGDTLVRLARAIGRTIRVAFVVGI